MLPEFAFMGAATLNRTMPISLGGRGEQCSPVQITRYIVILAWLPAAPNEGEMSGSRNKPTRIIAIAAKRQGIIGENANLRQVCRGRS